MDEKIGRAKKKKWTKNARSQKQKLDEKCKEPKTKIGRNFQPHTFDFDAASNTAKRAKS